MVARPIEEVRGTDLRAKPLNLVLPAPPVAPRTGARGARSLTLEQQVAGARWIIAYADGGFGRAHPKSGALLGRVSKAEAQQVARATYLRKSNITSITRIAASQNPIDLRRERPAWQAHFADGTNVYVDAETGQVLALRTTQWRIYDWMWGLHIMDLQSREDTHHPILFGFAMIAALGVVLALVMLPIAVWRRR
jgi:hypothetical protein